ncbi:MAG: SycD/LcrH family type III secretion system chaperone [Chlamydiia bacterium]|nr:SycD/LcrH family type III secretion system chaperone [Chlamydiia bacterium]
MDKGEQLAESANRISEKKAKELAPKIEEMMDAVFKQGMSPKDAMGMPKEVLEGIYAHAYHLYNTGKYGDSSLIFRLLMLLDPFDTRFYLGMAACSQMQEDYSAALVMYSMSEMIDPTNPTPHFHAGDCALHVGTREVAREEFKKAVDLAGDKAEFADLKLQSGLILEEMSKQDKKGATRVTDE